MLEDSQIFRHPLGIYAYGAIGNGRNVTLDVDSTSTCDLIPAYTDARGCEVAGVGIGLEADEVGAEHAIEDLFTTG